MMTVAAPADRRFRRARARPVRRRLAWLRRAWRIARAMTIAGIVLYAAYRGAALLLQADTLRVKTINIEGNSHVSTGELLAKLEDVKGRNIVTVDLSALRRRLLKSSWVAEANLRRVLPDTINVRLAEREPVGLARLDGALYLVDQEGVVIDEYGPNYAQFDLPIIDGLKSAPDRRGLIIEQRRIQLATRVLKAVQVKPELFRRISQVDVHDDRDAVVILANDTALLHLGGDQFLERLQSYLELAPALRARVPQIDYVDLRFDNRVYVRPVGTPAAIEERRPQQPTPRHRR